ncbi:MAG: twin-arginine translocase subunit TatB [Burkholderiales bacterium]|nr:twin-arginine translocase subunit TatB [Burkholderiales bacterium]
MFEVGFTELLLIFALALVVLGPEKLPRVANQVGRWIGRARAMARQFREQLEDETILDETILDDKPARKPAAAAATDDAAASSAAPATDTPPATDASPASDTPPREKYYQPDDDVARADVSHADAGAEPDTDARTDNERGT